MTTSDQITSAEQEADKIEQTIADKEKQIALMKIGINIEKDKLKAIRKGIEKLKNANTTQEK